MTESWIARRDSTRPDCPAVIQEPARQTPVVDDVDVLVASGGPAGIAAALSAVRPKTECRDYAVDAEVFKWQALEMLLEAQSLAQYSTPTEEEGCQREKRTEIY